MHTKVLIIGSGPAGYTAAIYAARAMLEPVMVQGFQPGGQLTITTDVENYPGFGDIIQGPWLMEQMYKQASNVGTKMITDEIKSVDFSQKPFKAIGEGGEIYTADTVIISTGASARWLGLESETKFQNNGVSACATCDGFFFQDKNVCVVGGGNSAVEEALYLSNIAKSVTLIHRRDSLRAEKILQDRLFANEKINVIWNSTVVEIMGDETVNKLKLQSTEDDSIVEFETDGLFVAIGHDPSTSIFKGQVRMDAEGYIKVKPNSTATNIPGVFAAGDVQDKIYRQAVTAAGMGCMAALEAEKFLSTPVKNLIDTLQ
jgi:thioredoxin reductase (NADPH)